MDNKRRKWQTSLILVVSSPRTVTQSDICCINKAFAMFQMLNLVLTSHFLSLQIKLQFLAAIVVSMAIYMCETWKMMETIT